MELVGISVLVSLALGMSEAPVPVILDTDIGDDIDDTWALAMLLGLPQVEIKLIVTACGDTSTKTRLVAKMLERLERTDTPIATGVKTGDGPLRQAGWLGGYSLTDYPGKVIEDGVGAMIEAINASPRPITLLAIGPQTNLKAALERDPGIAKKARVVTMAGSIDIGYGGRAGGVPEYNVARDVAAARAVFAAPWDILMAPLDVCGTLRLEGARYAAVADSEAPRARVVIENFEQWRAPQDIPEGQSSVLFDTIAAYLTFDEAFCEIETRTLAITDDGRTAPDGSGRPVRCGMRWKDRETFEKLLVDALTRQDKAE